MQWFRLYHEFATDPKVQSISETFQRRYVMLLCLKCNEKIPGLSDDEIAYSLRISEDETRETKDKLVGKGLITEDWNPTKWDKRQFVSDVSTGRVQKFRSKNVPSTDTDTDTEVKSLQKQKRNVSETFQPLSEFETAIMDFKTMRNKIKKPMTPRAETMLRNSLDKLGKTDKEKIAILEQSILHCWRDVYAVKDQPVNSGAGNIITKAEADAMDRYKYLEFKKAGGVVQG